MMKNGLQFSIVLFIIIGILSCQDDSVNPALIKPNIKVISPLMNSVVSDLEIIKVKASDNKGIIRLEVFINHSLYFVSDSQKSVYEFQWNTGNYSDGTQVIINAIAYDIDGNKAESKPVIVNIYRFMPINLNALIENDSLISLTWLDYSKIEDGFIVEEAINDSNFTEVGRVDSNVTSFSLLENINLSNNYYFRIRAYNKISYSNYTPIVKAEINLHPPLNINAEFLSDSILTVTWEDNNSFEDGYIIYINDRVSKYVPKNSTSVVIDDFFFTSVLYEIKVKSFRASFHSLFSETFYLRFVLDSPNFLELTDNAANKVNLTWQNNSKYDCKFVIERMKINETNYSEIGTTEINVNHFTDDNVDTLYTYLYQVKAVTKFNSSRSSGPIKVGYSMNIEFDHNSIFQEYLGYSAFSGDGKYFFLYKNRSITKYETATMSRVISFKVPKDSQYIPYSDLLSNYDGSLLVMPFDKMLSYAGGGDIASWNTNTGEMIKFFNVQCVGIPRAFSSDESSVLYEECTLLSTYNIYDGKKGAREYAFNNGMSFAKSEQTNRFFLVKNGSIFIYSLEDFTRIDLIPTGKYSANLIGVSDDGISAALYNSGGIIEIWNVNSKEITSTVPAYNPLKAIFSNNNKYLILIQNSRIRIYDFELSMFTKFVDTGDIYNFSKSPDSKTLITQSSYNLHFWKLKKSWVQVF